MDDSARLLELELGLPEGPVPWWEVQAEAPDDERPWPEPGWPEGVYGARSLRLLIVRVQAGSGSGAVARVEELVPEAGRWSWTVRPVSAEELLTGG